MLARRKQGWWSTLGMLTLVISAGWLVLVGIRDGTADVIMSVLVFLLAGVMVVRLVRRQLAAPPAPATTEQLKQAAATLAEVVVVQWAQETTARLLGDPEPIPVRWQLSATASGTPTIDHPEMITTAGTTFTGSSEGITELVAAFRRLDHRCLVIAGGPGTGKTTLAVQLLLELLDHHQAGEPVPVLFSLAGWDPREQLRLQDWLASQLERDYPALWNFGADTARALVARGMILPILDGLDEISTILRPVIIAALNDTTLLAKNGLIVTTRPTEYAAAVASSGHVMTAAAVVTPLALTRIDAASYLRKRLSPDPGTAWSRVLDQLETGTASELATVTASPLGLWLVRTVYLDDDRDPAPLVTRNHPDRTAHSTL